MSATTKTVKLEVQDDGMDQIRDAVKRKKKGKGNTYKQGFCFGKRQRVTQVAMMRYQGNRQRGKVLPGPRYTLWCA